MASKDPSSPAPASQTGDLPSSEDPSPLAPSATNASFDALIIGAGVSGLYQLYRFREMGLSVGVVEAGTDVGGTWYWNRYPGARFDSESYTYGYSWSEELLEEWDWKERFSPQPENLKYLQFVAEKFDLKPHIRFETRVRSAAFDSSATRWRVTTEDGLEFDCKYLVTAIGALSVPVLPTIDGRESFEGASFHTSNWPRGDEKYADLDDFTDKRVAVIGSGATAVQLIPEVAKTAGSLTVFQRTPNWCAPLHNGPIDPEEMASIKSRYRTIFETCNDTFAGFEHVPDRRKALETSAEDRYALWDDLWGRPGFAIWMANFRDVLVNEDANALLTEFVTEKIRERIDDPAVAERLIPTNHGFGTRRVPMETRYYEVYNQPNVELVSLPETPIEEITTSGVKTSDTHREFDVIIYATGFDAVTGAFDRIDITGEGGQTLRDTWSDGPRTYLGLQITGFPNLFTLVGPNNASTFCNMPRCIEQNVEWVSDFVGFLEERGISTAQPSSESMDEWGEHVQTTGDRMLFTKVNSWFMGINSNIEGKDQRRFLLYAAGLPTYRDRADEIADNDYEGFVLN